MKEERFFYDPLLTGELPRDEAQHALRVLRLTVGDELRLMDGQGTFLRAEVTTATNHRLLYRITEREPQERAWRGHLHLALAPTKHIDRTEWMVEKATEIGFDELSFVDCQYSERHTLRTDRIEKIVTAAVKQSHKAWSPRVNEMVAFKTFVQRPREGQCFICHCHEGERPLLFDLLRPDEDATVLIGPEGDFSADEVRLAEDAGYRSVSLGRSRLRTETAAMVAVHIMQLTHQI